MPEAGRLSNRVRDYWHAEYGGLNLNHFKSQQHRELARNSDLALMCLRLTTRNEPFGSRYGRCILRFDLAKQVVQVPRTRKTGYILSVTSRRP